MDIEKPVVVYEAAGNTEAHLVVELLSSQGIPAFAEEDELTDGEAAGPEPQVHRSRVYVDESNGDKAAKIALQFLNAQRRREHTESVTGEIEVECESCGTRATFDSALIGTTQNCPECFTFIDVGEDDWVSEDEWGVVEE